MMMLAPRLTDCIQCTTIEALLTNIDCRIAQISKDLYNNIVFMLNRSIPGEDMIDLLNYKRILTYKYYNSEYAQEYTIDMIASEVKLLTIGCKKGCDCDNFDFPDVATSTTTTTSTSSTTTTTTEMPI